MTSNQSIKKITMLIVLVATLVSCNQSLTLQTYYVDNEMRPGFTSFDIPTSFLEVEKTNLTDEQIEAYESVDKLNMLGFVVDENNIAQFDEEVATIQTILKDPKYEEFIRGGNVKDGKFMIKFLGDPESLDELILFGYAKDRGFAIIRILGNDMSANQLVNLVSVIQEQGVSDQDFSELFDFFD